MFYSEEEAREKLTAAFQYAVNGAANSYVLVENNTVRDKVIRTIVAAFEGYIRENNMLAMAHTPMVILHTRTVHASTTVLCLVNKQNVLIDLSVISA